MYIVDSEDITISTAVYEYEEEIIIPDSKIEYMRKRYIKNRNKDRYRKLYKR